MGTNLQFPPILMPCSIHSLWPLNTQLCPPLMLKKTQEEERESPCREPAQGAEGNSYDCIFHCRNIPQNTLRFPAIPTGCGLSAMAPYGRQLALRCVLVSTWSVTGCSLLFWRLTSSLLNSAELLHLAPASPSLC